VTGLSANTGAAGSSITITGQNFSGAAGQLSVFFGSTAASNVTVLSDTQVSVAVPSGSGTVDVTVQSGVNETDTLSSNPNANVNAPIFGYGTSATSPADVFTFTTDTTTTEGSVNASTSDFGQALIVTASVVANSPGSGTPAGSVDFFDTTTNDDLGSVPLVNGKAALSTTALPDGPQTITLSYGGNGSFQASSGAVNVTVIESVYVMNGTASGAASVGVSAVLSTPGVLDVDSNSASALLATGSAKITAGSIGVVGGVSISGSATVSPKPGKIAPFTDPLANLVAPTGGTKQSSVNLSSGSLSINPGIYSQIKVSGTGKLTMNPGLYFVAGGGLSVTGSSSVTGSGVTIYNGAAGVTGRLYGSILVAGNATVQLTAPTTGTYAGVAIFQSRKNPLPISLINSAQLDLGGGILYAPAGMLVETGGAQVLHGSYVVNALALSGGSGADIMANRGDALLGSGNTTSDSDVSALDAIMTEWTRTDAIDLFVAGLANSIYGKKAGNKHVVV
jgi:hypothetical protein